MLGGATSLPAVGPSVLTIPGLSGVALGAGVTGDEIEYRWPRRYKLAGLLFIPTRIGVAASLHSVAAAGLELRATDADGDALAFDTQGIQSSAFFVSSLALHGRGAPTPLQDGTSYAPRWLAFGREVRAGEVWRFQARNVSAAAITPWLGFRLEVLP